MRQVPGTALASSTVRARTLGYCGPVGVGLDAVAQVGVGEHIETREGRALCLQDLVRVGARVRVRERVKMKMKAETKAVVKVGRRRVRLANAGPKSSGGSKAARARLRDRVAEAALWRVGHALHEDHHLVLRHVLGNLCARAGPPHPRMLPVRGRQVSAPAHGCRPHRLRRRTWSWA